MSELKSAFSYILYTLERWQCNFLASHETFRPCSSITCLIIFPTCTFDIKKIVNFYLILRFCNTRVTNKKVHDIHVDISGFSFYDTFEICRFQNPKEKRKRLLHLIFYFCPIYFCNSIFISYFKLFKTLHVHACNPILRQHILCYLLQSSKSYNPIQ